jgi:hypothetical protein
MSIKKMLNFTLVQIRVPKNVICQKLVQVNSIEEYKLQFCTIRLPVTFCKLMFCIFLNSFEISVKF